MDMNATYSPEDNKLRLYTVSRLDAETYAAARKLGFRWAPKQELFVAPAWTPAREDFLLELCGEIGDEDTSLVDRAEQRAERFENYSDKREKDAHRARAAVDRIANGIPLGQPVLVGHHSERHARKAAEKIENGMRKAVKMWETSEYWTMRAVGALHAAKYKEQPAVRARRIKKIEAEARGLERNKASAAGRLAKWTAGGEWALERVLAMSGPKFTDAIQAEALTADEARERGAENTRQYIAYLDRWLSHLGNRLAYEKAMLAEAGGTAADQNAPEVGGACKCWASHRGGWSYILKVNPSSVTLLDNWGNGGQNFTRTIPFDKMSSVMPAAKVEELRASRSLAEFDDKTGFFICGAGLAPESTGPEALKKAIVKPLLNYPGVVCFWTPWGGGQYPEGVEALHMTKAEYEAIGKTGKHIYPAKDSPEAKHDTHRVRVVYREIDGRGKQFPVFLTDSKQHARPSAEAVQAKAERETEPEAVATLKSAEAFRDLSIELYEAREAVNPVAPSPEAKPEAPADPGAVFRAMKQTLKQGVLVVSAPQLFPTPPALAARMVELADIEPGHRVLEPSAGTGNLLRAIGPQADKVAVEISPSLVSGLLHQGHSGLSIREGDFMETADLGTFDRVVMNPPFVHAQDIDHIKRALSLLKPGGRLVAICANGPRQNATLQPLADSWEVLPSGTFDGTGVSAVLLTMTP